MRVNVKDIGAGMIFIGFGAFFALHAMLRLDMGTAFRMGSGYFPIVLGGLLACLGAAITARGIGAGPSPVGAIPWRGIVLISLAPIVFGATVRGLGLVPAVAASALLSAFASRRVGPALGLLLGLGLTAFIVLVFSYGLGISVPLVGPWLGG